MGSLIEKNIKGKPVQGYSERKQRAWKKKSENNNQRVILKGLMPQSVNTSDYCHPALRNYVIP